MRELGSCRLLGARLVALGDSQLPGPSASLRQPPPRLLELAASRVGDSTAFDHPRYMANVPTPQVQLIFCGDYEQLPPVPDKQGSLNSAEHLGNCVAAARRKDNGESRDEARRRDPAVDDASAPNGGWLDMSKNTPFGMRETTAKFAFQSAAWRDAGFHVHHLRTVHRTREPLLLDALTDLRAGVPGAAAGSKGAPCPLHALWCGTAPPPRLASRRPRC